MTEFPEFATYVGYPGQNTRWTDNSSRAIERRKRELEEPLAVVKSIRRDRLSSPDRLNYDLFRRGVQEQIEGTRFKDEYFAVTQLDGVQQDVGRLLAQMPTTSVQDYENILARLNGVPALVDQAVVLLGKGLEAGITPPRVTLRDVPDQIRGLTPDDPMASPLLRPFAEFPSSVPAGERERLTRTARDAYTQRVAPAYRKLYDYVTGTYLPKTRESIGMRELGRGSCVLPRQPRRPGGAGEGGGGAAERARGRPAPRGGCRAGRGGGRAAGGPALGRLCGGGGGRGPLSGAPCPRATFSL